MITTVVLVNKLYLCYLVFILGGYNQINNAWQISISYGDMVISIFHELSASSIIVSSTSPSR